VGVVVFVVAYRGQLRSGADMQGRIKSQIISESLKKDWGRALQVEGRKLRIEIRGASGG
jgi:hypothetical protein